MQPSDAVSCLGYKSSTVLCAYKTNVNLKDVGALTALRDSLSCRERGSEFLVFIQLIEDGSSHGL